MSNNKLKCAIITEGFTVKSLAAESKVNEQTIRRATRGMDINMGNAKAICKALNCTLESIFGGEQVEREVCNVCGDEDVKLHDMVGNDKAQWCLNCDADYSENEINEILKEV